MKLIFGIALLGAAAIAPAVTLQFAANLTGAQEVVPSGSRVTSTITISVDDSTGVITSGSGTLSQAFSTAITGFHIHEAPIGVNGGVKVDIGPGAFSGTNIVFSGQVIPAATYAAMKLGNTYFNIHTSQFGGGEIRGQIEAVPEPATLAGVALGLAALARRRRSGSR